MDSAILCVFTPCLLGIVIGNLPSERIKETEWVTSALVTGLAHKSQPVRHQTSHVIKLPQLCRVMPCHRRKLGCSLASHRTTEFISMLMPKAQSSCPSASENGQGWIEWHGMTSVLKSPMAGSGFKAITAIWWLGINSWLLICLLLLALVSELL